MKKRLICAVLIVLLAFSICGCSNTKTELAIEGIRTMAADNKGNVYIIKNDGLSYYLMTGDKRVENLYYGNVVYDKEGLSNAKLEWKKNGEDLVYSDLYIDHIRCIGEDSITMVGKYTSNNAGHPNELFVLQDAFDLNFAAGYMVEMDKEGAKNFINGIGDTEDGIYFKLNRNTEDGKKYDDGVFFAYTGIVTPIKMPDSVTGAIKTEDGAVFLVESKTAVELNDGEKTIKSFERDKIADAFVQDNTLYIIYKNGTVISADASGKETNFKKLKGKVSKVNDAFLYDGELYWFDKDGIKTSK